MIISKSIDEVARSISGARFYVILFSNYYTQEIKWYKGSDYQKTLTKMAAVGGFKTVSTALAVCQLKLPNVFLSSVICALLCIMQQL